MSTTTTEAEATVRPPPTPPPGEAGPDQWVCMPATWEIYTALLGARGERARPRYTFVGERLTAVSPGHSHESLSTRLAGLIHEVVVGLAVDCHTSGQVTLLKSAGSREGVEADASYYLTNLDRVRGKRDLVMGQDPPPDLVVEVVVSHPEADALEAYRALGVREVWVCKGTGLEFLVLGADGRYAVSPTSAGFPNLTSEDVRPWLYRTDLASETRVWALFRAWVEDVLVPRQRPAEQA